MSLKSTSLSLRDVISLTVRPSLSFKSWERIKVFNPCFLVRPFNRFVSFFLVLICQTSRLPALTSHLVLLSISFSVVDSSTEFFTYPACPCLTFNTPKSILLLFLFSICQSRNLVSQVRVFVLVKMFLSATLVWSFVRFWL